MSEKFGIKSMRCFLFILLIIQSNVYASPETLYPFSSARQTAQFTHLLKELRCLVCQNQDLSDSNASLAKDLRQDVYELVKNNQSDDEIIHYLTSRYGDFILFKPPMKSLTILLWSGPVLFLLIGLLVFWFSCVKSRRND